MLAEASQPFYQADSRVSPSLSQAAGRGSNDTRWLWPEYLRLIRECKPKWIVAENVAALLSIPEFKGIYSDLQAEGYEVGIYILSASGVGAPHQKTVFCCCQLLPPQITSGRS